MTAALVGSRRNTTDGASVHLTLPAGSAVGDLAILALSGNTQPSILTSGFTIRWAGLANDAESLLATKCLSAGDVSAGYIDVSNPSTLRVVNVLDVWSGAYFDSVGVAVSRTASPAALPTEVIEPGAVALLVGVYRSGVVAGFIGPYPAPYTGEDEEEAARLTIQTAYWINTGGSPAASPSGTASLGGSIDEARFMVVTLLDRVLPPVWIPCDVDTSGGTLAGVDTPAFGGEVLAPSLVWNDPHAGTDEVDIFIGWGVPLILA